MLAMSKLPPSSRSRFLAFPHETLVPFAVPLRASAVFPQFQLRKHSRRTPRSSFSTRFERQASDVRRAPLAATGPRMMPPLRPSRV